MGTKWPSSRRSQGVKMTETRIRKGMTLYRCQASDGSSVMWLTFFNNRYIPNLIKQNGEYLFYGKVGGTFTKREMTSPSFTTSAGNSGFHPVYGQTGTGIGLYLCKRIVLMHDGDISVRNNPGSGCSFRILLPLPKEDINDQLIIENNIPPTTPATADDELPKEKVALNILVVEDNADMRGYIRSILRDYYNVLEACNGAEAIEILNRQSIDFIVSDLMMPVMDGIELSRRVKETFANSHIPFLMLTAKTSPEARLESYRTGVDEYLLKPFDETLLLTRIENILENRRRYQRQFRANMDVEVLNIEEESGDKKFINQVMEVVKEHYKNPYFESVISAKPLG